MVLFFGILVVPLGLAHIVLVISQPVLVGSWCALCLLAALIMLPMIPLTLDEVVAMCQFLYRRVVRAGRPFWRTFWMGDADEAGGRDEYPMALAALPDRPTAVGWASVRGMSAPWPVGVSCLLGLWLVFAPAVRGGTGAVADGDHLTGALALTVAVIALAEVVRPVRFLNVLLGVWLIAAPWVLAGAALPGQVNGVLAGLALVVLSLPRGAILERYGTWDRYLV